MTLTRPEAQSLVKSALKAATGAKRTRNCYYRDKFWRLRARRGDMRATVAIAHKILVAVFHMLRDRVPFKELGPDYLAKRNDARAALGLVRRIEAAGFLGKLERPPT